METANSVRMTSKAEQVLEQALQLSEAERTEVVTQLLRSLESDIDEDAEQAWDEELGRRIAAVEAGEVELISWEEVRQEMRAKLKR